MSFIRFGSQWVNRDHIISMEAKSNSVSLILTKPDLFGFQCGLLGFVHSSGTVMKETFASDEAALVWVEKVAHQERTGKLGGCQ